MEIVRDDEDSRFRCARDGDHFMVPFQCQLCHFRNIQQRDPITGHWKDECLMDFIVRANLDAFWSREASTVQANLRGAVRSWKTKDKFSLRENSLFPIMGPHPLKDDFGMAVSISILDRSLDPGKYEEHVQWATFRKSRTTLTNMWQASLEGLKDQVGAYGKHKTWISSCPTHQFFFARFMEGIHRRVGETVKRDEPIGIELLKAIMTHLEEQWDRESALQLAKPRQERDLTKLRVIAMLGLWFCGGFCTGMRGEEMPLIELEGTFASLKNIHSPPPGLPPHFELVVSGSTKDNRLAGAKFAIPCMAVTSGSGLTPGIWAIRCCNMQRLAGHRNGRLFTMNQPNGKLCEFEQAFYTVLEEVQGRRPDLISPQVEVRDDYGILRSLRRGVTSHAINMQVDSVLIHAVNRWRVERASDAPNSNMQDIYAELEHLKPTILRYSDAL